jgi:hypothetical protein
MTNPKRILLCIGCDDYDSDSLSHLTGAEEDALNMYELLSGADNGDYPESDTRLLLSPTCNEVDKAFSELLAEGVPVDTLTIFFAGHGGVAKGSYYLCMKESSIGKLSTTAYSLSRLFEIINENGPAQCNIIIDACEAGGLVSNLGTLLKPELIGMTNTSGISIFATSAAKQGSLDTPIGGVGTTQLLRVLKGEIFVQDSRPYLDLVEVGRAAAGLIADAAKKLTQSVPGGEFTTQTPVVWGLNLFGQSRFSKNPVFNDKQAVSLHSMVSIPSKSLAGTVIGESSEIIWALFYDPPENLIPTKIFNTLAPITQKLGNEEDVVRFISGIATPLNERVQNAPNLFSSVELNATFIALLLEWCGRSGLAELQIKEIASQLTEQLLICANELNMELAKDEYALALDGLADLFYLPIRISKILGWCSAGLLINEQLGSESLQLKALTEELMKKILDVYKSCILFVSDLQSPYVFTILFTALRYNLRDVGENLFGLYMSQLFEVEGNIARPTLEAELAYDFLKARFSGELTCASPMVSNPCESLSVMLMMAKLYGLENTVDPYLSWLDHASNFIFIPDTHISFAQRIIEEGQNHNFQIGHGIWRVSDFVSRWEVACLPQITGDKTLATPSVIIGALCASLLFPNRTPWFLLRQA